MEETNTPQADNKPQNQESLPPQDHGENISAMMPACNSGTTTIPIPPRRHSVLTARIIKVGIMVGMLILLQIPLLMVSCQVEERSERLDEVQLEFASTWGGCQTVQCKESPDELKADVKIYTEMRNRGIYEVPVYTADVDLTLKYAVAMEDVVIHVSNGRAVQEISASVNGKKAAYSFERGEITIPVPVGEAVEVAVSMKLRGSREFTVATSGKQNKINISGDWGDPGFSGSVLPVRRSVGNDKFSAEWNVNKFTLQEEDNIVGVNLCITAGSYQQIDRTMNYASFFLIIFFFTLFVGEILAKQNIHPIQYIIASVAPVLFYLLLLAVSEHTGFAAAYWISASVIVLMVTGYARMFMGKLKSALIMGGVFAVSYAGNYFILRMEDMALLVGTVILVLMLGVMMLLTGRINQEKDPGDSGMQQ